MEQAISVTCSEHIGTQLTWSHVELYKLSGRLFCATTFTLQLTTQMNGGHLERRMSSLFLFLTSEKTRGDACSKVMFRLSIFVNIMLPR